MPFSSMAQGKFKTKMKLPDNCKKKRRKAGITKKKYGQVIAPKKLKQLQAEKIRKGLERTFKSSMEKDIQMKAIQYEPKRFHLLGEGATTSAKK